MADTEEDRSVPPSPPDATEPGEPRPPHRVAVRVLIVLAAIVLALTTADVWVKRQLLDTDRWVSTADELLAEDEIRAALSAYVVDQLYTSVDVAAQLEARLPDDLDGLAAPLAAGLRGPATEAVDRLLATAPAQELWSRVNRRAHETLVNILRDETRTGTSTAGGTVTIELRELVVRLADQLGLPESVVERIPEDVGSITVVDSDELESAQQAVEVVELASVLLFVLVVALYLGAIALAAGWRRVAVRDVGLSVLVVALVLLVVLRFARSYVLDNLVAVEENRPVVSEAWFIASQLLRDMAWSGVVLGAGIALGAMLVGPARPAVALRRRVAPAFASNRGATWAVVAVAVLVLVAWTPFDVFATGLGVLAMVLVVLGSIAALDATCRRELASTAATSAV